MSPTYAASTEVPAERMSGQPWGRTGRVTLTHLLPALVTEVRVGDELVGHVYDDDLSAWDRHRWKFSPPMPTADHALWWLLRRAAPKVWLEERPVVWRVSRCTREPFRAHAMPVVPAAHGGVCRLTWEAARVTADRLARAEYALASR